MNTIKKSVDEIVQYYNSLSDKDYYKQRSEVNRYINNNWGKELVKADLINKIHLNKIPHYLDIDAVNYLLFHVLKFEIQLKEIKFDKTYYTGWKFVGGKYE